MGRYRLLVLLAAAVAALQAQAGGAEAAQAAACLHCGSAALEAQAGTPGGSARRALREAGPSIGEPARGSRPQTGGGAAAPDLSAAGFQAADFVSVTAFDACGYTGNVRTFFPANYSAILPTYRGAIAFDNRIRSLQIPPGWRVVLYASKNFLGASLTLTASAPCLSTLPVPFTSTSSIRIFAPPPPPMTQLDIAAAFLVLVNQARARYNAKALQIHPQVMNAAYNHTVDQATQRVMSHYGSDGSDPGKRLNDAGYQWSYYGENVAAGWPTIESVFGAWMNSPGHRANILLGEFVHFGAALVYSAPPQPWPYWTQLFAEP